MMPVTNLIKEERKAQRKAEREESRRRAKLCVEEDLQKKKKKLAQLRASSVLPQPRHVQRSYESSDGYETGDSIDELFLARQAARAATKKRRTRGLVMRKVGAAAATGALLLVFGRESMIKGSLQLWTVICVHPTGSGLMILVFIIIWRMRQPKMKQL